MNTPELLNDLLDYNVDYLGRVMDDLPEACFHWQPEPEANSIAVTIWHFSRIFDVFKVQHLENKPAEAELWQVNGWAAKTGYDPRGIGVEGWGALTGYSQEEVSAVPLLTQDDTMAYFQEVIAALKTFIAQLPEDQFHAPAPGYQGRQSYYFWIRHAILDMVRHIGEILAIQAMWERRH